MDTNERITSPIVTTRRDFIKKTSTLAAVAATTNLFNTPAYSQTASSAGRVVGANDRIEVAVIGLGVGIGQNHLKGINDKSSANNAEVIAACDLFSKRRDWARDKDNGNLKDADVYSEYRRILDRKDIDAVVIATHDPWHAKISMDAMDAGKHVYCEKPMSRYLGEAFQVYDKFKQTKGLVFQIGSQGTSAGGWKKCAELVSGGKIGTLVWSQGYYCRNSVNGEWNSSPFNLDPDFDKPENIDWETWQRPVHNHVSFNPDYFHRWRKRYAYCAGVLGDLAPHRLHPLMQASGQPQFPVRVTSIGTRNVHAESPDTTEREIPEHQQLLAEFPSGYLITLTCGTVNAKSPGFVLYGHKATLNIGEGGDRIELIPEREYADDIDPQTFEGMQIEDIRMHEKNFFDCIRSGETPNGNIDLAIRVQTVISLAEMSNRLNMVCLFDEKTRAITNGEGKKIEAITYGTLPQS